MVRWCAIFVRRLKKLDNGPEGFTHADNDSLYSIKSLRAIKCGLKWFGRNFNKPVTDLIQAMKQFAAIQGRV